MKITKKQIKKLVDANQVDALLKHIITNGTKKDKIDALSLLFKSSGEEYEISFESVPYSRGGRYTRHTSTLTSTQKWEVVEGCERFYIKTSSTSNSGACPAVIIPKFYTPAGKEFHNDNIRARIAELELQKLA